MRIELKIINHSTTDYVYFVAKKMSKKWVKNIYGDDCTDEYYFAKRTSNNPYGNTWIIKHTGKYGILWDYCQLDKVHKNIPCTFNSKIIGKIY